MTKKKTKQKQPQQWSTLAAIVVGVIAAAVAVFYWQAAATTPTATKVNEPTVDYISRTAMFVDWMKRRGLRHDGTVIVEPQPGNRDVFATKDFKVDDLVMVVPHQVTIHDSMAKSDPIIAKYLSKYPKTEWVPIIGAFVLLHREDPLWEPYISFLPSKYNTPLYWNDEELKVIDGTDLSVDLVGQREEIQNEWNQWKEFLPTPISYDDFLWAWHIVMSRVWVLPVGELTNKAVLIPMVDVANHYGKPKVKIEYSKELGAVTMTATKPIKSGEQVDVTYGEDSSYKSLKYMGFTIPGNDRNEDCRVQLIRGPSDNFPRPKKWCLFHANNKLDKTIQSCHIGKSMEKETLTRVRDLVIQKLRSYPTSIKTDNELLRQALESGSNFSENFVNGVRERRGEKVCLLAVRKRLDTLIKRKTVK
ncbi:hypothetical protein BDR26DRAFT_916919 [Obelidium mucronatum]|nr:hypothetical protein BDR26DRAFT_916919 [Obelidium mucronatum]